MKKKIEWNRVTWYSKIVAIVIFVTTFFLGFYLGIQYGGVNCDGLKIVNTELK